MLLASPLASAGFVNFHSSFSFFSGNLAGSVLQIKGHHFAASEMEHIAIAQILK